ncbi:serpin family protein [Nannocystis bainbridge]|uniref:Serpin family protein n=1 Tax=Nannocystis bainbridge TaxID=2995303 RepID=A0ABT5DPZ0_9BACT|nr:serpin family protein [Nannocystis bainbridge]MDC0715611.1 serpin family protein [Nannocystis bainbridge]
MSPLPRPPSPPDRAKAPWLAFGMLREGARTISETEIQGALRFSLDRPRLDTAFNKIDLELNSRDLPPSGEVDGDDSVQLSSVQQMFGRLEVQWLAEFLDVLAVHYGSGLRLLDIGGDPEGARLAINQWVAGETHEKILELLPPMSIYPTVTGVLINAMYLKAPWKFAFDEVQEGVPFTRADGVAVDVAMMRVATEDAWYHKGAGFEALELPLRGESLSMAFILPDAGTFDAYVEALDGRGLRRRRLARGDLHRRPAVPVRRPRPQDRQPAVLRPRARPDRALSLAARQRGRVAVTAMRPSLASARPTTRG